MVSSSGPVNYDISLLAPVDYKYNTVGYLVPDGISKVIGGKIRKPQQAHVHQFLWPLFTPPYGTWLYGRFFYEYLVEVVLIALLLVPFLTLLPSGLFKLLARLKGSKRPQNKDWRPWTFNSTYLAFISCITVGLIALVVFLQWRSQQPDPLVQHEIDWSGGSVSSGPWTGDPFNSRIIRSPTFDRPPRGLCRFTITLDGVWSQKNGAQRLGRGVYSAFTYLPMLLAVLYGRMWKVLDDDIKRIDMYYRLQKPNGTTVFCWEVYSGAALDWPDTYSWQVALVEHGWAYKLIGALAVAENCCLVLFILIHSQKTGLSGGVRGIAGLVDLLEEFDAASLKLPSSSSSLSLSKIEEKFASSEFHLIDGKLKWKYGISIDPRVYQIVGILVQLIVDVIDHAVRSLAPFYALAQDYPQDYHRLNILWADYTSNIPPWEA
ncbi:hypothetical protein PENSUB_8463 [Penicillium subrubescens]|uniref:Uncharacterized protein n=1 Tax=Penicillium subrubescens TaxID=1316194 RepID=A0A1Q5TFR9_9EURO|nr:hypothetical protein PENSUB_8463 [Penicillium subrubescens]